jgi:hypothetical protein
VKAVRIQCEDVFAFVSLDDSTVQGLHGFFLQFTETVQIYLHQHQVVLEFLSTIHTCMQVE